MLSLILESCTWYIIVSLVITGRYVSRWLQLGSIVSFQPEDYIMLLVFAFYTSLIFVINTVYHLDTNLMTPDEMENLTPSSTESRIRGSKLVLVVEQCMIMTTWGCKICLLIIYHRLMSALNKNEFLVKLVSAYVVLSWIVMEGLWLGFWCRPFHDYWAVPTGNMQCSTGTHHMIVNAVFNISSDAILLFLPAPILVAAQLPREKKFILGILFSLGSFVILAAGVSKEESFNHPFSSNWTFWYVREASTALLVSNMPMCWNLLRRMFNLRSFMHSRMKKSRTRTIEKLPTYNSRPYPYNDGQLTGKSPIEKSESREYIIQSPGLKVSSPSESPLHFSGTREERVDGTPSASGRRTRPNTILTDDGSVFEGRMSTAEYITVYNGTQGQVQYMPAISSPTMLGSPKLSRLTPGRGY